MPTIAWHSLNTALYKDEAFKSSWGTLLVAALIGTNARVNPRIYPRPDLRRPHRHAPAGGPRTDRRTRPRDLVGQITAPTLLIQGTVDTLFTLAGGRRQRDSA